jgi:hypothetical protein
LELYHIRERFRTQLLWNEKFEADSSKSKKLLTRIV